MKLGHREALSQRFLRLLTLRENLQLPDHVGAGLTRPDDVTIDFGGTDSIVDRLLPGPMHRVQTRIDHQPPRPEQLVRELSKASLGIAFVPTRLGHEMFGVQRPAFREGRQAAKDSLAPECGQLARFLLEGNLEVMAGHALVIDQRTHFEDLKLRPR